MSKTVSLVPYRVVFGKRMGNSCFHKEDDFLPIEECLL